MIDQVNARGVSNHRYDMAGGAKTVCTSHVLAWFGIDKSQYHYSGTVAQRSSVLRRFGYAVRSRNSACRKASTVNKLRGVIAKISGKDPHRTMYMIRVRTNQGTHAMLLDGKGHTIVDTAPVAGVDRRKVLDVRAVWLA